MNLSTPSEKMIPNNSRIQNINIVLRSNQTEMSNQTKPNQMIQTERTKSTTLKMVLELIQTKRAHRRTIQHRT